MYNLGEQFKINIQRGVAKEKNILKGRTYRFTVLTERLIRLEYNENGNFIDSPTERVLYRDLETPKFDFQDSPSVLVIQTSYFKLTYQKEKTFAGNKVSPDNNLKVELLNTDRSWYYGHPEIRNFGMPNKNLNSDKITEGRGLYSADGIASLDDTNSLIYNSDGTIFQNSEPHIDIYLFMYNNDYEEALKDYYKITGYPALVSRYALGVWWSRNLVYNDLSLKELVDTFEREEIPLSLVVLDKDWHDRILLDGKPLKTGFTFNKKLFRSPKDMTNYLHGKSIRIGLSVTPSEGLFNVDPMFKEALKYLPTDEMGKIPFNAFDPKFVDVYLKLYIHQLDNFGIDFYWLDTQNTIDNLSLNMLKHYEFYDMQRDYKRRPLLLSNLDPISPHRYPVAYSGKTDVSWKTLAKTPFYNNNTFNIGAPFIANDVAGYYKGTEDAELYIRSVQLATFSPILKFGSDSGKYYKREPWRWDIKTYTIVKQYLQLRHKLIPYIYSEAYKYHKFGDQLIKPLYYQKKDFYDDVNYRNEYYFGKELFIAPITTPKESVMNVVIHNFYLPEGIWYDFVTGKKFPGGRKYTSFFRDQDYPVFARQGAIIPMGYNDNINDTTPPKNMEINIFPGKSNTYTLFEDDGESDLYRKDFYLLTQIDYNYLPNNYSLIIRSVEGKSSIVPDKRNYKIIFRNTKHTNGVNVYSNRDSVSFKTYIDGPNFVVEVNDVSTIGQLTINCQGNDIEIDAVRLINDDIERILSDLQISTTLKEKIDTILFGKEPIKKKRIAIRKLSKDGLDKKFIKMFLRLLEYIDEI